MSKHTVYLQVQQDLQLLYCEGHISRCGPFGKSKVAIMETALLLHVLEHFLHVGHCT